MMLNPSDRGLLEIENWENLLVRKNRERIHFPFKHMSHATKANFSYFYGSKNTKINK